MTQPQSTPAVAAVLTALTSAFRANMVSYLSVPEECQPPRFVVEFASGAEVRAFAAALHHVTASGPLLATALGEIAAEVIGYDVAAITSPEVLQHLIHSAAADLMVVVEDLGPVKVIQRADDYRDHLTTIAALALAGLLADRRAAAEDTLAACAEGRRPKAAPDVPVGQSWATNTDRSMADIIAANPSWGTSAAAE